MALTLSVLLALLGIAAFPCWRHSARWGYLPSMAVGFLLVLLAAVTVGGKPLTDDARIARLKQPVTIVHDVNVANAADRIEGGPTTAP
ncbi:MAG TPA: DUF3309 family protein [Reyranella sp.]|nr:DUF3309 family protein [Reyranella sp.]